MRMRTVKSTRRASSSLNSFICSKITAGKTTETYTEYRWPFTSRHKQQDSIYNTRLLYLTLRERKPLLQPPPPRMYNRVLVKVLYWGIRFYCPAPTKKTFPSSFFLSSFAHIHSIPYSTTCRYTHTSTLVLYLFHTAFSGKTVISPSDHDISNKTSQNKVG